MSAYAYSISVPIGTEVQITVPINLMTGNGFFPTELSSISLNGQARSDIINGFLVENINAGTIMSLSESTSTGEPGVKYTQLTSESNKIYFFSDTGQSQAVSILPIPIHDHGSITSGGPAYGTYYSES